MKYVEIEKLKEFIENNWHSDDNEKRNEQIIYASEFLNFIHETAPAQVVPIEPTKEMIRAVEQEVMHHLKLGLSVQGDIPAKALCKAMLEAAKFKIGLGSGWASVIDEALVIRHLGVIRLEDTYDEARAKLDMLLNWEVAVATDEQVNGGKRLVDAVKYDELTKCTGYTHPPADKDADFRRGAKAMFDYVLYATANNWHGNPEINKQCEAENEFANKLIADALAEVSPEDEIEWKNIVELQQEINRLKAMKG